MSRSTPKISSGQAYAVLTLGFRPFFLAATLWAIIAIIIWMVMLEVGNTMPSRFDPLSWHIHEMLFGFVGAAIAGFLLTAIPNWTQRPPVSGSALAALLGLWLMGRLVCLVSALLPLWLSAALDLSFPVALAAVACREILAARNWRNVPMVVPIVVLGGANLLMHLEVAGIAVPPGMGWRLGLAAVVILVSAVASRIVPSFTRNWLVKRDAPSLPASHGTLDRIALGILHLGLLGWVLKPEASYVGGALLLGAVLSLWRMARWRGTATTAEPLLLVLHVGYGWLVAGAAVLGLTTLGFEIPFSAAVHTLTVGAVGTMVLAVMTRTTLGHTGRSLTASRMTSLIYLCIGFAALARLAAAFDTAWNMVFLLLSAALWIVSFSLFAVVYGRFLLVPRHVGQETTG